MGSGDAAVAAGDGAPGVDWLVTGPATAVRSAAGSVGGVSATRSTVAPTAAADRVPLTRVEVPGRTHSSTRPGTRHRTNPITIAGHDTTHPGTPFAGGGPWTVACSVHWVPSQ